MRHWLIFCAHVKANAFALSELMRGAFTSYRRVIPAMCVFVRRSVEDEDGKPVTRTREIGVGYYTMPTTPATPREWVHVRTFYREIHNRETKTWRRVIPTSTQAL
jgi:hypothetical protein